MNEKNLISALVNSGVGILPTDTVYGVVGRLMSEAAVDKIYKLKRRDASKPVGTILIASTKQIEGIVPRKMLERAAQFWPGAISIITPVSNELAYAHKGLGSLPFRVPDDVNLVELLRKTGPLATSSANLEGQPPATTLARAKAYFGLEADFYVDGGDLSGRKPSRIIILEQDGTEKEVRA